MAQTLRPTSTFIPAAFVNTLVFRAAMWGIRRQAIEGASNWVWVTLAIDFGVQMHVKILVPADNAEAIMVRTVREIKLMHGTHGLAIHEINTGGLAVSERDGWAIAVTTT